MKASHILFSLCTLVLLCLTAVMGLMVEGRTGYMRHVMLGVLSGFFTCFVHVVFFMYFVVQQKIMTESILHHALDAGFGVRIQKMKSLAFRLSMAGFVAVLTTAALGGAIDSAGVAARIHLIAAFSTILVEAIVFYMQIVLLGEYRELFREAFDE